MQKSERRKLPVLLDDLAGAIEELLLSGLTTASTATRQKIDVAFREASRMRLLRLGSTLRIANEEIGRFLAKDADFSRKRLMFFLNRAWLLSRGLARSIRDGNDSELARLLHEPERRPVETLRVVTLGVVKKVARGTFCAFEFRLRLVEPAGGFPTGQRLTWSCIFPLRAGVDIPPEGFLHLPQKQGFTASAFLDRKVVTVTDGVVAGDEAAGGRLSLTDDSQLETGNDFCDWDDLLHWNEDTARQRLADHEPDPFDIDIELHEELVLREWQMEKAVEEERDGQVVLPLQSGNREFDAVASSAVDGEALRRQLERLRKKKEKPPLFGIMHYEMCRQVVQPLTTLEEGRPVYLTISDDKVDRAALLQTLKF